MAPAKVVCTCLSFGCGRRELVNEFGQVQPGHQVASATCKNHEKRDREMGLDCRSTAMQVNGTLRGARKTDLENLAAADKMPRRRREEKGTDVVAVTLLEPSISGCSQSIYTLLCMMAAWLHLVAGLSRDATNLTLRICGFMVTMSIKLGYLMACAALPSQLNDVKSIAGPRDILRNLPTDVRTAMQALSLDPCIIRTVCCPSCLSRYSFEHLPENCYYRETPRSRMCNEPLWTTRSTRSGPQRVPCRLYSTQDFDAWLDFFLSRPGIEDLISRSYDHQRNYNQMQSIWDSPAWRSLGNFTTTRGNLTFSFYIDWFNPLTNKIAGKSVSCGAIMFFCLNLPQELQHLPENTYFAGITPPPREPTVVSITNLTDPIIDRFEHLYRVGKLIQTHNHPDGMLLRVGILPAIGDLLAMRKAMGFAGVGSKVHFCLYCKLHKDDIEELDTSKFTPRIGTDIITAAQEWQEASTKKEKDASFRKNGARWSPLHLLTYRDPVRHTVLGLMHNWVEGVLQHHARVLWGIGVTTVDSEKKLSQFGPKVLADHDEAPVSDTTTSEELELDQDFGMFDEEIEQLRLESQQHSDLPLLGKRQHASLQDLSMVIDGEEVEDDGDFRPEEEAVNLEDDSNKVDDDEAEEDAAKAPKVFNTEEMALIHSCLSNAVIPSWTARPPTNLGERSHGKLKADQWLILFTIFLPLILPEIWLNDGSKRKLDLLNNFHHLVTCTNIVCAHSTSNLEADRYTNHYTLYRCSSKEIFRHSKSRPNHHYAMHNGDLMKFWGPLMNVSEYPYETHNGSLQRINTNNHMWELDFTMLRNVCRRGCLTAMFEEGNISGSNSMFASATEAFRKYTGSTLTQTSEQGIKSAAETAAFNGSGQLVSEDVYTSILTYLSQKEPSSHFRHHSLIPHPPTANVLPNFGQHQNHFLWKTRSYSTFKYHEGNSSISYRNNNGMVAAGSIQLILEQMLQGKLRTFLVISPYPQLSGVDEARNLFSSLTGFHAAVVYDRPRSLLDQIIIEPNQIVGHVPLYRRPAGTFGIAERTIVIINSLHRDR